MKKEYFLKKYAFIIMKDIFNRIVGRKICRLIWKICLQNHSLYITLYLESRDPKETLLSGQHMSAFYLQFPKSLCFIILYSATKGSE